MRQTSLMGWVKEPRPKRKFTGMYFFETDVPEFLLPTSGTAGPFRKGDLVSEGELPTEVWNVLLRRGVVKPYVAKL